MRTQGTNARAAWPSNDDYTLLCLPVLAGGLAVFAYLLWTSWHEQIVAVVAALQHWQMRLLHRVSDGLDAQDRLLRSADYATVTAGQMVALCDRVGRAFRLPAALYILGLAVLCFLRAAPSRFRRDLDLDGLMREHAKSFPAASAFVGRDLRLVPIRAPEAGPGGERDPRPADPALKAAEWVARYAPSQTGALDEGAARRELARQLGPLWRGVAEAAPHVRVLFAAFALHLAQRREEALALLGDVAGLLPRGGDGPAGPECPLALPAGLVAYAGRLLRDADLVGAAAAVAARHAYTATALMGLLTEARLRAGVLAPSQFNGFKLIDRRLWYALDSLGFPGDGPGQNVHPNPLVEAAGARDHWAAERTARGPLAVPAIDRAVAAVRTALRQAEDDASEGAAA